MESRLGIKVDFFCDDNKHLEKCPSDVMLFDDFFEYKENHDVSVFLSNSGIGWCWFYDFEKFKNVSVPCQNIVTYEQFKYYLTIFEDPSLKVDNFFNELRDASSDEILNSRAYITLNNLEKCKEVYELLADELSRKVFIRLLAKKIIDCKFFCDIYSPNEYFDKSLIQLSDNEVFFDVGAYDGDTVEDFIKNCENKYNYIYAFEPDNSKFPQLVKSAAMHKNVAFLNVGLYDETGKVRFRNCVWGSSHVCEADDATGDSLDYEEKLVIKGDVLNLEPTFIKMDIEGAELKALSGLEKTIKSNHPQLAICAYHKPEDLWLVPLNIKKIDCDYKIFLRHHSYTDSETVCYARKEIYIC